MVAYDRASRDRIADPHLQASEIDQVGFGNVRSSAGRSELATGRSNASVFGDALDGRRRGRAHVARRAAFKDLDSLGGLDHPLGVLLAVAFLFREEVHSDSAAHERVELDGVVVAAVFVGHGGLSLVCVDGVSLGRVYAAGGGDALIPPFEWTDGTGISG